MSDLHYNTQPSHAHGRHNRQGRFVTVPCVPGGFPESSAGKEFACSAEDSGLIPGLGISAGEGIDYPLQNSWVSLVAQLVKNLPAMWEAWVWLSLSQRGPGSFHYQRGPGRA